MQDSLIVSDLRKSFRTPAGAPLEVLRGLSFSVQAGEMVAVMGPSGAGKSTLLHLIGGLEEADGGTISLGDFEITGARSAPLARYRNEDVGFVFQFHHLLPDLTAEENVALPLFISRVSWQKSLARAAEALENLGLGPRRAHLVGHLSGGEQQRVALARAMIHSPRLVLADEPTGNLDTDRGQEIGALLNSYCRTYKAAVLLATHNAHLASLCDRKLVLEDGKIVTESGGPN